MLKARIMIQIGHFGGFWKGFHVQIHPATTSVFCPNLGHKCVEVQSLVFQGLTINNKQQQYWTIDTFDKIDKIDKIEKKHWNIETQR